MKTTFLLFTFLSFNILFAQNLVLNPSFEDCTHCERSMGQFDKSVTNWSTPSNGSTDYFNYKGKKSYNHYNGYQKSRTGIAHAGIYVFTEKNYREYIQGTLSQTLEKGQEYIVTFYVSLAEKSTKATTDLDMLFTEEELKKCHHANYCEKNIRPKKATKKQYHKVDINDETYYREKLGWTKISFTYTALGFENYFSIGNFKSI